MILWSSGAAGGGYLPDLRHHVGDVFGGIDAGDLGPDLAARPVTLIWAVASRPEDGSRRSVSVRRELCR